MNWKMVLLEMGAFGKWTFGKRALGKECFGKKERMGEQKSYGELKSSKK